ncbi:hypothetical protein JDN40_16780 [Rhodomicrobium vannielii ATCC 17100]|uniref:hypothetical protein n=1 Tax=Rhodomicrobium vannielii TaxID=1069 RepID=UPI00191897A3|nr:hypothetical protein [Rhodomicrobium vannielii]MBJ7535764.1 hypothetical protein [Rhodomicrobium vannielii ATCC 17100]
MTALNAVAIERPGTSFMQDVDDLSEMIAEIAEPRKAIERTFLEMGERLICGVKLLRTVSAAHEAMGAEFQGRDFLSVVGSVHALRNEVADIVGHLATDDTGVGQLAETIQKLKDPLDDLGNAVRMLGLIALNARVVAAGIDAGHEDLAAFVAEMTDIGRDARATVRSILDIHTRVCQTVASAKQGHLAFNREQAKIMATISERLRADLATIELQQGRAAAHATRSGQLTSAISARIGDAIAAMQIGDSTRQRLEHVEDILGSIKDRADDDTQAMLFRLAALQLASTNEDFVTEVGALSSALDGTRRDAEAVLEEGRERADEILADSSHALTALGKNLQSIVPLLQQDAEMRRAGRKLGEETADAMQEMLGQMDAIEATEHVVQLLRLNMAIRCTRLGESAHGLRVIAAELGAVAKSARSAATRMRQILTHLKHTVEAAREGAARLGVHEVNGDPMAAARLLEAVLGRVKQEALNLKRAGPKTIGVLDEAAERVRHCADGQNVWPDLISTLTFAAGERDFANLTVDLERLAAIRSRYTMHKERVIHDQACGGATVSSDCIDTQEEAGEDLDSLLF